MAGKTDSLGRRTVITGLGAAAAGAGCITIETGDGDPASDEDTPQSTETARNTPNENTETETEQPTETESDDASLEEKSPQIAKMRDNYNGSDGVHNWIVTNVEAHMDKYGYEDEETLADSKEPMGVYEDDEVDATGERYVAEIDILTDRFGPYADLEEHKEEGNLDEGEQVREEITYLLGVFMGNTLEEDITDLGDLNVAQQKDHQDAVSEVQYNLNGAKGGSVSMTLNNKGENDDMDYVSNEVYGTDDWSRENLAELANELLVV